MEDLNKLKASVRSVLLSCGKTATEQEFRKAFFELEGRSFNEILRQFNTDFISLFTKIPDTAKIAYVRNMLFIQRVSSEKSAHMDKLTINKYGKNYKGPKLVTKSGAIKGRPSTNPLNYKALPYHQQPSVFPQRVVYNNYAFNQLPVVPQRNINVTFNYANNQRGVYQNPLNNTNAPTTSRPQQQQSSTTSNQYWPATPSASQSSMTSTAKSQQYLNNNAKVTTEVKQPQTSSTFLPSSSSQCSIASTVKCEDSFNNKPKVLSEPLTPAPMKIQPTASTTPNNLGIKGNKLFREAVHQAVTNDEKKPSSKSIEAATEAKKIPLSSPLQNVKQRLMKLGINRDAAAPRSLIQETSENKILEKLQNLKLNETETASVKTCDDNKENSVLLGEQGKSPAAIRAKLRSMRHFREALQVVNSSNETTENQLLIEPDILVQLPAPIQNEEEPLFDIKVLDVFTPFNFTFQFNFKKLKELNEKLNEFYRNLKDDEIEKYRVKQLVNENIVAVCRECCWYRAQIKSFNGPEVQVQFVDTMKVVPETISSKCIFHLHQKFTTESPKSAFGKIYGLKPKDNGEWNILSTSKLIDIQDKIVLATVKSVSDDVYSLVIFPSEEQEERIFDMLIAEDLAEIDVEVLGKEIVSRSLV